MQVATNSAPTDTAHWLITPQNSEAFWTMVAALLTAAAIIVAWRGLAAIKHSQEQLSLAQKSLAVAQQDLRVAQEDAMHRATREARMCAIERCEEFAQIIMENWRIVSQYSTAKIPVFIEHASEVRFDPDNADALQRAKNWRKPIPSAIEAATTPLMNSIEAWAMYFAHGIADHEIAYGPCAPAFCKLVVRHYPWFLISRASPASGNFPNVVKLFKAWNSLLEKEQRGLKAEDLKRQLEQLSELSKEAAVSLPKVLGPRVE